MSLIPGKTKKAPVVKPLIEEPVIKTSINDENYAYLGLLVHDWGDYDLSGKLLKISHYYKETMACDNDWVAMVMAFQPPYIEQAWNVIKEMDTCYAFGTGALDKSYKGNPFTEDEANMRFYLYDRDGETAIGIEFPSEKED